MSDPFTTIPLEQVSGGNPVRALGRGFGWLGDAFEYLGTWRQRAALASQARESQLASDLENFAARQEFQAYEGRRGVGRRRTRYIDWSRVKD
jgi:hypothetical protein